MENVKRRLIERFKKLINEPHLLFPVLGFIFVSLLGTLLHFLPDLAENNLIRLFCPTNESVWEHLKLLFYPYLIFCAAEYFAYGKYTRGFLGAKVRGVLAGEGVIVAVHYTVSGIIGRDIMWIDVTLFFVGAAIAYILPYLMIKRGVAKRYSTVSAVAIITVFVVLFSVFTFFVPKIGLFFDPESGTYGF